MPTPPTTSTPPLTVRQLQVDLSQGFARHWHSGDAFRSAYYNALSMSFPYGEQLFIDSVRACLPRLPHTPETEHLHNLARDFCAQEATHRHVHTQYNAELQHQGFRNHWEPRSRKRYEHARHINPMHHLAITAAFEHYTAVFADVVLRHPQMLEGASPEMQQVWRWHALEETEHKAVAFDLYQTLGGSHGWRVRWFLFASISFSTDAMRQTVNNLWHDGTLLEPRTLASAAQFFFGRPSQGGGWVWLCTRPLLRYLHKDFHPNQLGDPALARDWAQQNAHTWRVVR